MARVTVEDCLKHVDNRFNLVLLASRRARQLANGVAPLLPRDKERDKPTVLALREIGAGLIRQEVIAEVDRMTAAARARQLAEEAAAAERDD